MNPQLNFYDVIDVLKDGVVDLVYDKIGRQFCVMKRRDLRNVELYRRLREIKNPYLPEIYRVVEFDDSLYVVEKFIEGQMLAEFLTRNDSLDEKISAQILRQLCECLKPLHAQKIIHRDIKPSNIMLTKNNGAKLIDFGISRIEKDFG